MYNSEFREGEKNLPIFAKQRKKADNAQLQEIKKMTEENELAEIEIDILVTLLEDFAFSFETLSIEQKVHSNQDLC